MNITREKLKEVKEEIVKKSISEEELEQIKKDIYIKSQEKLKKLSSNDNEEQIYE